MSNQAKIAKFTKILQKLQKKIESIKSLPAEASNATSENLKIASNSGKKVIVTLINQRGQEERVDEPQSLSLRNGGIYLQGKGFYPMFSSKGVFVKAIEDAESGNALYENLSTLRPVEEQMANAFGQDEAVALLEEMCQKIEQYLKQLEKDDMEEIMAQETNNDEQNPDEPHHHHHKNKQAEEDCLLCDLRNLGL